MFIFKRDRAQVGEGQRERERETERGREGDTESEAGSRFWAASTEPDMGFEPTNRKIMTWTEVDTQPTEPPGTPASSNFNKYVIMKEYIMSATGKHWQNKSRSSCPHK